MIRWILAERFTLYLLRQEYALAKDDPLVSQIWNEIHGDRHPLSAEVLKSDWENRHGQKRGTMYNAHITKPLAQYNAEEVAALHATRLSIHAAIARLGVPLAPVPIPNAGTQQQTMTANQNPPIGGATGQNANTGQSLPTAPLAPTQTATTASTSAAIHRGEKRKYTSDSEASPGTSAARPRKPAYCENSSTICWTDDMRRVILILKPRVDKGQASWNDLIELFEKVCADDLGDHKGEVTYNHLRKQAREAILEGQSARFDRLRVDPANPGFLDTQMKKMQNAVAAAEIELAPGLAAFVATNQGLASPAVVLLAAQEKLAFITTFLRHQLNGEQRRAFFQAIFHTVTPEAVQQVLAATCDEHGDIQPEAAYKMLQDSYDLHFAPRFALQDAFDSTSSPLFSLRFATYNFGGTLQMLHTSEIVWRGDIPTISDVSSDNQTQWFVDNTDLAYRHGGQVHRVHAIDSENRFTYPRQDLGVDFDVILCNTDVCDKCRDPANNATRPSPAGGSYVHAADLVLSGDGVCVFTPREPQITNSPLPLSFREDVVRFLDGTERQTRICVVEDCASCPTE